MADDDRIMLLQAAVDGELDAAGMVAIEARLAADHALAAEHARILALRQAIGARIPRPAAPEALRLRLLAMASVPGEAAAAPAPSSAPVIAMTGGARQSLRAGRPWLRFLDSPYRSLAASLMLGVALGASGSGLLRVPVASDDLERAIVAGYVRGRLTGQPVDVATSDRHTVKPWLAARIGTPTTVLDLAKDGFPLVGGRIDVVGANPVPTLIYQRREHQIALSETPDPDADSFGSPRRDTRDGYALLSWAHQGLRYTAVSDLPPAELDAFWEAFRRAATGEREEPPKL